jgi:dihydropteroate synthase
MAHTRSWQCGSYSLNLAQPIVMGILNVTTDSFSDGGLFVDTHKAVDHALLMQADGAAIIDIGGESTRPGASAVSEQDELARVIPIVEALASRNIVVSVDTQKPAVMREAIAAGAAIINDVNALQAPGAMQTCAAAAVGVCLMHRQGTASTMQVAPHYQDVVDEVAAFLVDRAAACKAHGISAERIAIDQGYGFGKTIEHNLSLLRAIPQFAQLGYPLLAGVSRKSLFNALLGREVQDRLAGSLATAVLAAQAGAKILRVHDVKETVDALKMLNYIHPQT